MCLTCVVCLVYMVCLTCVVCLQDVKFPLQLDVFDLCCVSGIHGVFDLCCVSTGREVSPAAGCV